MGKESCDFSPRLEVERFGRLLKDERFIRGVSLWWQGTVSNINWAYQEFVKKSSKLEASLEVSPQNRLVSPDFGGIEEFTNPEEEEGLTLELLLLREKWLVDRPIGQIAWISPGLDQNDHSFLYLWTRESRNQNKVTLQALRLDIRGDQLNQFLDRLSSGRKTNLGKNLPDGRQRILATSIYSETEETFLTPEKVDSLLLALTTNQKVEIFEERMTLPRPEFIFWPERTVRLEALISNSIQPQGLALGLRPFLSESGRQSPILIFRNNETKIEAQNALVFEEDEKKQEVQQKPPAQEVPIGAKFSQLEPLSMFPSRRELAISQIASIIEKNSSQTVVQEAPVVLLKKQVPQELFHYEPTVKVETQEEPVVTKEKQEVAEEAITIPLIEIPMGTSMIYSRREKRAERVYIIEARLEPLKAEQIQPKVWEETPVITSILQSIENNLPTEEQEFQPQGLTLSVEEAEGEEVFHGELVEEVRNKEERVREQEEPKILAVRNLQINYSHISIYRSSKPASEIEKLEVKKLVWVVNSTGDQTRPAISELEFSKDPDPNKATLRFLHFLRKVARKVVAQKFGNDILRTRKIKMIRADEPVEVIRKIEYYLEVLKGTYAQVFAFVS